MFTLCVIVSIAFGAIHAFLHVSLHQPPSELAGAAKCCNEHKCFRTIYGHIWTFSYMSRSHTGDVMIMLTGCLTGLHLTCLFWSWVFTACVMLHLCKRISDKTASSNKLQQETTAYFGAYEWYYVWVKAPLSRCGRELSCSFTAPRVQSCCHNSKMLSCQLWICAQMRIAAFGSFLWQDCMWP